MNPISDGLLLAIDKPAGWSSHDVVAFVRKGLHGARVGHAGTLDPFATGLLLVAVGRIATKSITEWSGLDKVYRAVIRFGTTTDTLDRTGETTATGEIPDIAQIEIALKTFLGDQMQMPPVFSAIKVGGRKSYKAARKGTFFDLAARPVTFSEISLLDWQPPDLTLRIACSKGTYIRAFARDIAVAVGTVGMLQELCRERIGEYDLSIAASPQNALNCLREGNYGTFAVRRWEVATSVV